MATSRPDTLDTVVLALEILRRIPRTRKITAGAMREQLSSMGIERTLRTIQRQLDLLSTRFDIERDEKSKPYGYRWSKHAQGFALSMLSEQESLLLRLAELHLRPLLPTGLMKSLDGFFAQARTNLNVTKSTGTKLEQEWLSKVTVISATQPRVPPTIRPGVFEQVSDALYANRRLKLAYIHTGGRTSQWDVLPLALAQQGPRLYLVCRHVDCNDERTLAMHRIDSAQAQADTFERPKEFDLKRYGDDGRFAFGEGRQIRLRFLIDEELAVYLRESPLSLDQVMNAVHGKVEIAATVVDSMLLERWLRGFGNQITEIRREPILGAESAEDLAYV